jgi:hypothetical protein
MGRPKKIDPTPENIAEVQTEMFAEVSPPAGNIPPKVISRNQYGLLNGVDYIFKEDGTVDWKKMIPKKYFVINRQREENIQKALGKPIEEVSIEEVDEKDLLVLLGGFRHLADLRGFNKVEYSRPTIGPNGEVSVACSITWEGNYETHDKPVTFTGLGDATTNNTAPIGGVYYLTAIAENRSYIRAVRNYLRLENILGRDEIQSAKTIAPKLEESDSNSVLGTKPIDTLLSKCKKLGITWLALTEMAEKCKSELSSDYTQWKTYKDIPGRDIYILIGKITEKK